MLQQDRPKDYVIGTGESHSVKEFLEEAFDYLGLDWREYTEIDQRYLRPTEVESLLADASEAKKELGWNPKVAFKELVRVMVDRDLELIDIEPPGKGQRIFEQKGINWTKNQLAKM